MAKGEESDDILAGPLRPVDLEIRITTPWGRGAGRNLEFVLSSPSGKAGFHHESIAGKEVDRPDDFKRRLLDQLTALRAGRDVDGGSILHSEMLRELQSIGHDLYRTLFPREMRTVYREIHDKVETLLVTSDEPWIPWELLHPFEFEDDDFLCMRFRTSRWLAGSVSPAPGRRIRRLSFLDSGDLQLEAASSERGLLQKLVGKTSGLDGWFVHDATSADFLELVENRRFDLLHYVGHGEHDAARPGEAKAVMADRGLRARHLSPQAEKSLREQRPIIFFNTCQLGQIERSLSDLDGWAPRWIKRCGCSAFLAPLWAIRDQRAARFAEVFYEELHEGRTLGEAVLLARHKLRDENAAEMTWLAYSLYGHPNARILFGDHEPVIAAGEPASPPPFVLPTRPPISREVPDPDGFERGARHRRRPVAPPRVKPERSPTGTPSTSWWTQRKPTLAAAAMFVLLALVGLGTWLSGDGETGSAGSPSVSGEEAPGDPGSTGGDEVVTGVSGVEKATDTGGNVTPPPPPPPSEPSIPTSAVVPGRLGIVVLDRSTGRSNRELAQAIEGLLFAIDGVEPLIPTIDDPSRVGRWMNGDFSSLPTGSITPWGAEHLLLVRAEIGNLAQGNPNLTAVSMTLSSRLVDASSGSTLGRANETHTGMGASRQSALAQAAERCLEALLNELQGE